MDVKSREDDCRHRVSRHCKREHRYQRPSDAGVVRRFARDDPFHGAFAERTARVLHALSRRVVGDDRSDGPPRSGQRPDKDPDERGTKRKREEAKHLAEAVPHLPRLRRDGVHCAARNLVEHLRKPEEPYQGSDQRNASLKIEPPERQTNAAGEGVDTYHAQQQSQKSADAPFDIVLRRQRADRGQAEKRQQKVVHRGKSKREARHRLGDEHQDEKAEDGADEGVEGRCPESERRLAFAGHRIPVKRCHYRGRSPRNIDQNGGDRACVHPGDKDPEDDSERVFHTPCIGNRHKERRRHCHGKAGDSPHEEPRYSPGENKEHKDGVDLRND